LDTVQWEYVREKRRLIKYHELEAKRTIGTESKAHLIAAEPYEAEVEALKAARKEVREVDKGRIDEAPTRLQVLSSQIAEEFPYDEEVLKKQEIVEHHERWTEAAKPP
jgi:hypothetical protein